MDRICLVKLGFVTVLCLAFSVGVLCQDDESDTNVTAVYIVTLRQPPAVHQFDEELMKHGNRHNSKHGATAKPSKPKQSRNVSRDSRRSRRPVKPRKPRRPRGPRKPPVAQTHESLLRRALGREKYLKLYSYNYLINGFAVLVTPQQADKLSQRKEVANVVLDFSVRTATTHTPQFLGLTQGAWAENGGYETAGEGIVIGFIDTGIDPTHPSFSDNMSERPFPVPPHFSGACEVTPDFSAGSCNRKLIGARHFAASAITRGIFNLSQDYASPFDGDGHGTHTAAVAAGNHGIPVVVAGHNFGNASGMAPRAHISVYKALYKSFGGFAADVVAAIDQAAQDGVNIISLSITPNRRPPGVATFFNPIDMVLLSAVKAGIFVVQAAGNTGPSPGSMSSFSPWITTVGAAAHDRIYPNSITLGNNLTVPGVGLAPGTEGDKTYTLISAIHAVNNNISVTKDMYVGECQDGNSFDQDLVRGNLLICSYTIRFELGLSSIKQALDIARNLSAAGVVFYMDPHVVGFQLNPTPMNIPGIVIPSPQDSRVLLEYYNSLVERDEITKDIVRFRAVGRISGGLEAKYGNTAPKVMYYSARGPDPEDTSNEAEIMKPNLVAPGNLVWAAWSSLSEDSVEFQGENFAMMSGTSIAASHIAGIAALIKQKFPDFTPSTIASSLSTSATLYDNNGGPVMAQHGYPNPDQNQSPAVPFDMGSGFVNATAALNPGLVFDTSFDDYMSYLCSINGSSTAVYNYTNQNCQVYNSTINGPNLNLPSITIAKLDTTRTIQRWARNVASNETYNVGWSSPYGVSMQVSPTQFFVCAGATQMLNVSFNATKNSSSASFGRIGLFGNMGHVINIPVSVIVKSL